MTTRAATASSTAQMRPSSSKSPAANKAGSNSVPTTAAVRSMRFVRSAADVFWPSVGQGLVEQRLQVDVGVGDDVGPALMRVETEAATREAGREEGDDIAGAVHWHVDPLAPGGAVRVRVASRRRRRG